MAFDIAAARKDGVPESAIAEYLAKQSNFDLDTARKDGVPDNAIADYLAGKSAPAQAKPAAAEEKKSVSPKREATWGEQLNPVNVPRDIGLQLGEGLLGVGKAAIGFQELTGLADPTLTQALTSPMAYAPGYIKSNVTDPIVEKLMGSKLATPKENLESLSEKQDYLRSLESKPTQISRENISRDLAEAEGWSKLPVGIKSLVANPRGATAEIVESIPAMVAGSKIATGLSNSISLATRLGVGEGLVGAGFTSENMLEEIKGAKLDPTQKAAAVISGIFTGVLGAFGQKVSKYIGATDVDELFMAGANRQFTPEIGSKLVNAIKTGLVESTFEELPQGAQDQIAQNLALGKPWDEGVAESMAHGLVSAFPMGATFGAYEQHKANQFITGKKDEDKYLAEAEAREKEQAKKNAKFDTQSMTAEEKERYKAQQAGIPVPLTLAEKDAENYVTGTNAPASGASANLSGESDVAESEAGTGDTDRGGLDGAGSDAGATASGTNAQPTTLTTPESLEFPSNGQAQKYRKENNLNATYSVIQAPSGKFVLTPKAPVVKTESIEAVNETPAFNEAELQEAGEVVKDETPIEKTPLRVASPEALAAKARRDTWLGKSPEEIAAQRAGQVEKSPLEEVENQQAEAEALAEKLVPSEEVSEEAAVETAPKAEEVIAEEEVAAEPVKNEAEILQEQKDKATAKVKTGLGKIAGGLSKTGRMNVVPEEEVDYLKEITDVFSGAIELGNVSFQQASAYVAEQLKEYDLTLDDIKEYLEEAYSRATAGLRSKAKQKQEAELENKQIAFAADEPARAKILDQNEAERIEQNAYPFIAVDTETTDKEIEGFEYNRQADPENKFRGWDKLSAAQQALYSIINRTQGPNAALKALNDFSKDKAGIYNSVTDVNAALYELNKKAAAKEHQIEFPLWQELSEQAQANFLETLPKISTRLKKGQKYYSQSGTALHNAFEKVAEQLEKENVGYRGKKKIDIENAELALQSEQAQEQYQDIIAKESAAEKEAVGKGVDLSQDVVDMLEEGNINGVLRELLATARGIAIKGKVTITGKDGIGAFGNYLANQHRKATAYLYRSLAEQLSKIDFQSTVITDIKNPIIVALRREGKLAEYDPKTDTFYFTPEGLDEATVLHEVVHAATVRLISRYLANPQSLTKPQREAIEHIEKLFDFTKPRLNGRFPNAFENLYEFVAYALTDSKFQFALSNIQARSLAKFTVGKLPSEFSKLINAPVASAKNILNQFTEAIMKLYGIVTGSGYGLYMKPYLHEQLRKDSLVSGKETFKVVRIEDLSPAEQEKHEDTLAQLAEYVKTAEEKELFSRVYSQVMQEGGLDDITGQELKILNKSITARLKQIQKLKDAAEKKAAEKKAAEKKAQAEDKGSTSIEVDEEILAGYKKGYEGNALFELTELFNTIIAAPLVGTQVEPLAAKAAKKPSTTTAAKPQRLPTRKARVEAKVDEILTKTASTTSQAIKAIYGNIKNPRHLYRAAVRRFENNAQPLKLLQAQLKRAKTLIRDKTKQFNDTYSLLMGAAARSNTIYMKRIGIYEDILKERLVDLKKQSRLSTNKMFANVQLYLTGLHEPERRRWFFMRSVPLRNDIKIKVAGVDDTPANHRERLLNALEHLSDTPGGMTAKQKSQKIREHLDNLIFSNVGDLKANTAAARAGTLNVANVDLSKKATSPHLYDENDERNNVVGGYSVQDIDDYREELDSLPYKDTIYQILKIMKGIQDETININLESNFYTQSNVNYINMTGYDWYIPFKGRPEETKTETEMFRNNDTRYSGDLQFWDPVAKGRESLANNPIAQTMVDAKKASYILAHQPVTESVVNNIKQGNIVGKLEKTISQEEKYKIATKQEAGSTNTIFHHLPNGKIQVWKVEDPTVLAALRRPYKSIDNPVARWGFNAVASVTRVIGQGFTRFNPKFAPANAVKDIIPNLFYISKEYGSVAGAEFLVNIINTATADTITGGGVFSAGTDMYLLQNNKRAALEAKAKTDDFTKLFLELEEKGGIVSFLQGVSTPREHKILSDSIKSGTLDALGHAATVGFDYWLHMAEMSVRVSVYKTVKEHLMDTGKSEAMAIEEAAHFTKEVANFEHTGINGKGLAALYTFARATATGVVRYFDDLSMVLPSALDSALKDLPPSIVTYDKGVPTIKDKAAYDSYVKSFKEEQIRARVIAAAYIGMGIFAYMAALSGSEDDDKDRNIIATDDPVLYTRSMRFSMENSENMFQIPTGYGPGSLIALGQQMAILYQNNQTPREFVSNIATILQDSFMPFPVSRIPITDHPIASITDTLSPSFIKPVVEYALLNMNGLGMQIIRDQGDNAQAYTSHGNIPEIYKTTAVWISDHSGHKYDISPNALHFFASNYINGFNLLAAHLSNLSLIAEGDKDYDIGTDNPLVGGFVGRKPTPDSRELNRIQEEITSKKKGLNAAEASTYEPINAYLDRHPGDKAVVDAFNSDMVKLNELRHARRVIEANKGGYNFRDKKEALDQNKRYQEDIKYSLNRKYKDIDPTLKTSKDVD
jgi:hypothetical protein